MIQCSILKIFKLFYISTSLFISNSSLYTDPNHKPIAIVHEVEHPNIQSHYEFVILRDERFRDCFLDHDPGNVILSTPHMGLEVWRDRSKKRKPIVSRGTFAPEDE